MNRILRLRDGSALNIVGLVALGLLVATIVIAVLVIMPVYSMYKSPPKLGAGSRATAQAVSKFHDSMTRSVEMVDGRSWFYEPKPPQLDTKVIIAKRYEGPQLLAFINGTAWFADGQRISASEPKSKTLELVKSNAPWSITVKWEGGTFDVDLFKKVDLLALKDGGGFTSSYPASTASFGARPPDATSANNLNGRPMSDRGDHPPEARFGPGVSQTASPASGETPVAVPGTSVAPQPTPAPAAPPTTPPANPPAEPPQPTPPNASSPAEVQFILKSPVPSSPAPDTKPAP